MLLLNRCILVCSTWKPARHERIYTYIMAYKSLLINRDEKAQWNFTTRKKYSPELYTNSVCSGTNGIRTHNLLRSLAIIFVLPWPLGHLGPFIIILIVFHSGEPINWERRTAADLPAACFISHSLWSSRMQFSGVNFNLLSYSCNWQWLINKF